MKERELTYMEKCNVYSENFGSCTNTSTSFMAKLKFLQTVCFYAQRKMKKDPENFKNCYDVLKSIFPECCSSFIETISIICDDLLWGTNDDIPKPDENYKTLGDVKLAIIKYINEEWMPF